MRNFFRTTSPVVASWGCVPTTLVIGLALLATVLCLQLSCSREPLHGYEYEEMAPIPEGQWAYADTVRFSFSIADTSLRYNLYLSVEHADTFPYQNLYVRLHTFYPKGQHFVKLLPLDLFDATGKSHGVCTGRVCQVEFVLQENAIFPQLGRYKLGVEQYMRFEPVKGIRALRLRVEAVQPKAKR